jgi:hypothetical protein
MRLTSSPTTTTTSAAAATTALRRQARLLRFVAGERDGRGGSSSLPSKRGEGLSAFAVAASSSDEKKKEEEGVLEINVDELKQLKEEKLGRAGKYRAKVAGSDTPEWVRARVVSKRDLLPKLREVVLEVETSRELVALQNSYCAVGKTAQIKVKGSEPLVLVPACAPFPAEQQHAALLKLRGDLKAGQTKLPEEVCSVKQLLSVLVTPEDGDAYDLYVEDEDVEEDKLAVEVGPFLGNGMSLRGAIQHLYNYPTILICAQGQGIGTAKALIENVTRGSLDLKYRDEIRLFYKVPNDDSVCYAELFDLWESEFGVKTVVHTSSFLDAFDDDETLEYEPESTAVISMGEGETEKLAEELCEEAEIKLHIRSSQEQEQMHYADTGGVV